MNQIFLISSHPGLGLANVCVCTVRVWRNPKKWTIQPPRVDQARH